MILHTVILKIKEGTQDNLIDTMISNLNVLDSQIPEINWIKAGRNFSERSKGFDVLLNSEFESKEALEKYSIHPAHVAVVEQDIKPIICDIIAVDIEV